MATDPVCGMEVDPQSAKYSAFYKGETYYFCSQGCKARFLQNPESFLAEREKPHPK